MKRCVKCVLPESYPGIAFDAEGICNFCRAYVRRPPFREKKAGEDKLKEYLAPYISRNGQYDCVVGVSGGRDSSFILWYVVHELGMRPLACFVDNGLATEQASLNVKNLVDALGVDLVVERHDHVERHLRHTLLAWMHRPTPATIAFLCAGCTHGIFYGLRRTGKTYDVPLIITGAGEPETSFARQYLANNQFSRRKKVAMMVGFLSEVARNPRYLVRPVSLTAYAGDFVARWWPPMLEILTKRVTHPDMVKARPFDYIEWDEDRILSVIREVLAWKSSEHSPSTWRSDCKLALFKNFLYQETVGFTRLDVLLSNMIRRDMVARDEALKRLESENQVPLSFVSGFLGELGLRMDDLRPVLETARNWQPTPAQAA